MSPSSRQKSAITGLFLLTAVNMSPALAATTQDEAPIAASQQTENTVTAEFNQPGEKTSNLGFILGSAGLLLSLTAVSSALALACKKLQEKDEKRERMTAWSGEPDAPGMHEGFTKSLKTGGTHGTRSPG